MTFPNMRVALFGLTDTIQFKIIHKAATDFEAVETSADVLYFQGCLQPIPPQALRIKPEGERKWKYWRCWTVQKLAIDDVVQDTSPDGKQYRVTDTSDWSNGGYFEHELREQPKP